MSSAIGIFLAAYQELELLYSTPYIATWLMPPKSDPARRVVIKIMQSRLIYEVARDRMGENWSRQKFKEPAGKTTGYVRFHEHSNMLQLIGHSNESKEVVAFVAEYCKGGNLTQQMEKRSEY